MKGAVQGIFNNLRMFSEDASAGSMGSSPPRKPITEYSSLSDTGIPSSVTLMRRRGEGKVPSIGVAEPDMYVLRLSGIGREPVELEVFGRDLLYDIVQEMKAKWGAASVRTLVGETVMNEAQLEDSFLAVAHTFGQVLAFEIDGHVVAVNDGQPFNDLGPGAVKTLRTSYSYMAIGIASLIALIYSLIVAFRYLKELLLSLTAEKPSKAEN